MKPNFFERFKTKEEQIPPNLLIEEYASLNEIGRINGTIFRSEKLSPDNYGDAIWQNEKAICVIDTSAPREEALYIGEADMVNDLEDKLSAVFDGALLTEERLMSAINIVLTSNGRDQWRGNAEFGISIGGIYYIDDKTVTCFNIGTGALYVNGEIAIAAEKEFHNPYPVPNSKAVKTLPVTILNFAAKDVESVIICTDGIDFGKYSPDSKHPISEFIVPKAKEATILKIEK